MLGTRYTTRMDTCLIILLFVLTFSTAIYGDFNQVQQLDTTSGCNVTSLPNFVDWCNDEPNRFGIVKQNSVCQSTSDLLPFFICNKGVWTKQWDLFYIEYRHRRLRRRGIGPAVKQIHNHDCTNFCHSVTTGENPRQKPPYFSYCSPSLTIHPDDPDVTNETFIWVEPIVVDPDGQITVSLLNPNETHTDLQYGIRPGTKQQVTYEATDSDNLIATCSFTIIGEVRTCPPVVHPNNANTTCSHDNLEGSNCTFECRSGYQRSGPAWVECESHEEWSDQSADCLPVTCDGHPDNVTDIDNGSFICGSDQGDMYSVCWVRCSDTYTLRNDQSEEEYQTQLTIEIMDTRDALDNAEQEMVVAQQTYDDAFSMATILTTTEEQADAVLKEATATVTEAAQEFKEANDTYIESIVSASEAQQDALNAEQNGYQNSTELQAVLIDLLGKMNDAEKLLNESLVQLEKAITVKESKGDIYANASMAAFEASIENATAYGNLQDVIDHTAILDKQLASLEEALAVAKDISAQSDKVINSYALCNENMTWIIQGAPQCVDLQPPKIKCDPLLTLYIENGTNSITYTWEAPEVKDNSGLDVNVTQISGPEQGAELDIGLHKMEYMATDAMGNESPVCVQIISVQEMYCGSPTASMVDNMQHTCTGYTFEQSCDLNCGTGYAITGDSSITCERDDSVQPARFAWSPVTATCDDVTECPDLAAPDHGDVNCDNETSGFRCTIVCDVGYVLPYKTANTFVCDGDGSWIPAVPEKLQCLDAGEKQYTEYTLKVVYTVDDCMLQDTHLLQTQFAYDLEGRLSSFDLCSLSYTCSLNFLSVTCEDDYEMSMGVTNITFSVLVTCSDVTFTPWANSCDLADDIQALTSMVDDVKENIENGIILEFLSNNDTVSPNTVRGLASDVPECKDGSVLVGAYCERCQMGCFYNPATDQCDPCPVGHYNGQSGLLTCSQCPEGTSTVSSGATSELDCRAECQPGTFSSSMLEPCLLCEMGHYQEEAGATACTDNCKAGKSTVILGSASKLDCEAFDMYFDRDVASQPVNAEIPPKGTIVFRFWSLNSPLISFGLYNRDTDDDPTFGLEVINGHASILYDGWDNKPVPSVTIEPCKWTMLVLTWDIATGTGNVYINGKLVAHVTYNGDTRTADQYLLISASKGTVISGFSISSDMTNNETISNLIQGCFVVPPNVFFTTGSLNAHALRQAGIKHIPTICNAADIASGTEIDQCQTHACQNGASCYGNSTGYTCNCTEAYTGPFCDIHIVDGGWSDWYNETGCSVTCGEGVQLLYRFCNNPYTGYGGSSCSGKDTDIVDCVLESCPECPELTDDSGTRCVLNDDEVCTPFCPQGWVLPKGQHDLQYTCGKTTGYQWAPLNTLPACAESIKPARYESTIQFTVTPDVPCPLVITLSKQWDDAIQNTSCPVDNRDCTFSSSIIECKETGKRRRRKRQEPKSGLIVVYGVSLKDGSQFDLSTYYNNIQAITSSITEAVQAIFHLETVSAELQAEASQLNIQHDGVTYLVNYVATNVVTLCNAGYLPIEGVCAACQIGTQESGGWCIFCGLGTYKDTAGPSGCSACPVGKTTKTLGARGVTQCVDDPNYVATPVPPTATPSAGALTEDESNLAMIIGIVAGGVVIIVIILIVVVCKLKHGKKRDHKGSQILKFGDENYNLAYKRRHVMGFDQDGDPVLSSDAILRDYEQEPYPSETGEAPLDQGLVVWPPVNQGPFVVKDTKMNQLTLGEGPFNACKVQALHEEQFTTPTFAKEARDPLPKMRGVDRFKVPGRNRPLPLPIAVYENGKIRLKAKPIPESAYTSPRVPFPPEAPPLKFYPPDQLLILGLPPVNKDNIYEERDLTDEDYHTGEDDEEILIDPTMKGPARFPHPSPKPLHHKSPTPSKSKKKTAPLRKQPAIVPNMKAAKPPESINVKEKKRKVLKLIDGQQTEKLFETAPNNYVPMLFSKDDDHPIPHSLPPAQALLYDGNSPVPIPPPTMPKVFDVKELKNWPRTFPRALPEDTDTQDQNRTSTPNPPSWQNGTLPHGMKHLPTELSMHAQQGETSGSGSWFTVSPRDVTMVGDSRSSIASKSLSQDKLSTLLFPPSKVHPETELTRSNSLTTERPAQPNFNSLPRRKDSEVISGPIPSFKQSIMEDKDSKITISLEKRTVEGGPLSEVVNTLPSNSSPRSDSAGSAQFVGLHNSQDVKDMANGETGKFRRVPSNIEIS